MNDFVKYESCVDFHSEKKIGALVWNCVDTHLTTAVHFAMKRRVQLCQPFKPNFFVNFPPAQVNTKTTTKVVVGRVASG